MMLDIKKLFQKISFTPKYDFVDSEVIFFGVNELNRNLQIIIKLPKIANVNEMIAFQTACQTLKYNPIIQFQFQNNSWNLALFKSYWPHLAELNNDKLLDLNLWKLIELDNIDFENNEINITVSSPSLKFEIEKKIIIWQNIFAKYGFNNLKIKIKLVKIKINDLIIKHIDESNYVEVLPVSPQQETVTNKPIAPKNKPVFKKYRSKYQLTKISDISQELRSVKIEGNVFKLDYFQTKTGRFLYNFWITNFENSIIVKGIDSPKRLSKEELATIKVGNVIAIYGDVTFDSYSKELIIWMSNFEILAEINKDILFHDNAPEKRVELHVHTKMSTMDSVIDPEQLVKTALAWKHKAIAVTDHVSVQSFPDLYNSLSKYQSSKNPLKIIYGCELNVIPELTEIVYNKKSAPILDNEYIIFDLETTGLWANLDDVIEFGAVKIKNNVIVDQLQFFIKPNKEIPPNIIMLTSINNEMVKDAIDQESGMKKIAAWIKDTALVAHNANFDYSFLAAKFLKYGLGEITNLVIDTLALSRLLNPTFKRHRLGTIAKKYNVSYDTKVAHRADYDAEVLQLIFVIMMEQIKKHNITNWQDIDQLQDAKIWSHLRSNHVTALVKNNAGLKDLFKIISLSHTKYFAQEPKIIKSELNKLRSNLLLGTSCSNNEIFNLAANSSVEKLASAMAFYDYVEVQPLSVYDYLAHQEKMSIKDIKNVILKIINTAKKINKIIIASSDAHYLRPHQQIFRDIYINSKGIGGRPHPLFNRANPGYQKPKQHLRNTKEMLFEFEFLNDSQLAHEIVIKNTNIIADMCEIVVPIKTDLYTPTIPGSEEKLTKLVYDNAYKQYGKKLPEIIKKRISYELEIIINNGFAVIYWISHQLVDKSNKAGYLVGSRGSVGSSLVATLANITEVNPLEPYYLCSQCHYLEFQPTDKVRSGYDLKNKKCPNCPGTLVGDGHNIPFETFLGFNGDKIPDIDLNFSGEYQAIAHNWTKKIFGEKNVYRAGTISTVAEKTAYGYIKAYEELMNIVPAKKAQIDHLISGCIGVKRTTGQHPGGIIIIPSEYEVEDFTPINFPANDTKSEWLTTHFDFHAIHDNLLKLDLLGHDDPTAIRMLEKLTGVNAKNIPNNDDEVMAIFSKTETLGIKPSQILGETTGAAGIPEFGTQFVRKMLSATKPKNFSDLIQISGLSHGTDVWTNNAKDLIKNNVCQLEDVIGCRDDIMSFLISKGIDSLVAFKIMESVRKGKGLSAEWMADMKKHNVPEWYINSCIKIKYMFPKAHATAYVIMAWRIAWFKRYYALAYYATFFSIRCDIFDIETCVRGKEFIKQKIITLKERINDKIPISSKEKNLLPIYEISLEMYVRGYTISNIDIRKSLVDEWIVNHEDKTLVPPFTVIDGLGINVAKMIVISREQQPFYSIEDIMKRTSINKTVVLKMREMGIFKDFQEKNQFQLEL